MGDTYVDNKIVLHLTRGNETVLNKTFTKNDFSSVVDANFSRNLYWKELYTTRPPRRALYMPQVFVIRRQICICRFL